MGIQVAEWDTKLLSAINLRAQLDCNLICLDVLGDLPDVVPQIAVRIDQAGNFLPRSDGAPTVVVPLAVDKYSCFRLIGLPLGRITIAMVVKSDFLSVFPL